MWPTLDRISVFSTKKRRGQIFSDWVGRRPAAAALGFCPDGCNLGFLPGGAFGATCVSLQRPPSGQGKGVPGAGGMHSWVLPGWPRARLLKTSCSPSPATVSLARRGPSIACAATTWEGWLVVVSNRESGSPGIHPVGLSPAPCSAVGSRCQTGTGFGPPTYPRRRSGHPSPHPVVSPPCPEPRKAAQAHCCVQHTPRPRSIGAETRGGVTGRRPIRPKKSPRLFFVEKTGGPQHGTPP